MNAFFIALQVVVAVIVMATIPLALRRRWRLFIALPLSVFQIFVPGIQVAGFAIPLAFWGGLTLWPDFVREFRNLATWKPTAYILGIVLMDIISLLWSPDRKLALQPIGYFMMFLIIFSAVVIEARRDEKFVLRLLTMTVVLALVQAFSVIIFRLSPGLKLGFLISEPAKWFISPHVLSVLFTTGQNNVLNPGKSGGMITVDANGGATYLGGLAFTALGLALCLRKRWLAVIGLILLGSVLFTGSKAGLLIAMLLFLLTLQAISMRYRGWRNRLRMAMVGIVLLGAVAWLGPKAIEASHVGRYQALASFVSRSNTTLGDREEIWAYAMQAFPQHPFRGQGFGGWQQGWPRYARKIGFGLNMAPQNTLIYLWSQGGLLTALLGLAFIYRVLRLGWRQMHDPRAPVFTLSLAITMAFLWDFTQGMGENFGLLGITSMTPLLACLLALGYLHRNPRAIFVEDSSSARQNSLNDTPSIIGAVNSAL